MLFPPRRKLEWNMANLVIFEDSNDGPTLGMAQARIVVISSASKRMPLYGQGRACHGVKTTKCI